MYTVHKLLNCYNYLWQMPRLICSPQCILPSPLDYRHDIIGSETEFTQITDPFGLKGFGIGIGWGFQFAPSHVTRHHETIPRTTCRWNTKSDIRILRWVLKFTFTFKCLLKIFSKKYTVGLKVSLLTLYLNFNYLDFVLNIKLNWKD